MIGEEYQISGLGVMGKKDAEIVRVRELTEQYAPENRVSVGGEAILLD